MPLRCSPMSLGEKSLGRAPVCSTGMSRNAFWKAAIDFWSLLPGMVAMTSFSRLAASTVRSHSACQAGFSATTGLPSVFAAAAGLLSAAVGGAAVVGLAAVCAVGAGAVGLAAGALHAARRSTDMPRAPQRGTRCSGLKVVPSDGGLRRYYDAVLGKLHDPIKTGIVIHED